MIVFTIALPVFATGLNDLFKVDRAASKDYAAPVARLHIRQFE